jgi:hypothetical protein
MVLWVSGSHYEVDHSHAVLHTRNGNPVAHPLRVSVDELRQSPFIANNADAATVACAATGSDGDSSFDRWQRATHPARRNQPTDGDRDPQR